MLNKQRHHHRSPRMLMAHFFEGEPELVVKRVTVLEPFHDGSWRAAE
nr:hypothetical protein [Caenimonas soli]